MSLLDDIKGEVKSTHERPRLVVDRCVALTSAYYRECRELLAWRSRVNGRTNGRDNAGWLRIVTPHDSCTGLIIRNESLVCLRYDLLIDYVTQGSKGERAKLRMYEMWYRGRGYFIRNMNLVPARVYDATYKCLCIPMDHARGDVLLGEIEILERTIIKEYIPNGKET